MALKVDEGTHPIILHKPDTPGPDPRWQWEGVDPATLASFSATADGSVGGSIDNGEGNSPVMVDGSGVR